MTVYELTRDQLDELKEHYFWNETNPTPSNAAGLPCLFAWDIPDEIIINHYAGITFVNDDFSCTACRRCHISADGGKNWTEQHLNSYEIAKEREKGRIVKEYYPGSGWENK